MRGETSEKPPCGRLGIVHVIHPVFIEGGDIAVVGRGAREDLGVAHPAQALIALRAVGRDAHEVAALAPDDVALKLVDHRVGAGERPGMGVSEPTTQPVIASWPGMPG